MQGWGGRRAGVDVAQRQGLAPGVGAGGDAVVDGGAEELLEPVVGFGVEGGGIVITQQQRVSTAVRGSDMAAMYRAELDGREGVDAEAGVGRDEA